VAEIVLDLQPEPDPELREMLRLMRGPRTGQWRLATRAPQLRRKRQEARLLAGLMRLGLW
jgi:hypothetical protein